MYLKLKDCALKEEIRVVTNQKRQEQTLDKKVQVRETDCKNGSVVRTRRSG